ncbi:hypothetical protein SNE40_015204 [Patella caerulea]|uniref:Protein kinase domain-containing protein n=1 Tax=Patella caerulea TaxID=87958 RepID=A0AAN8PEB3_PATCE
MNILPSQELSHVTRSTNYHLYKDRIGTGSSCDVFKGYNKETSKVVALKIFKDDTWSREMLKEVTVLTHLRSHPNIVQFYGQDKDTETKLPILVMEYCSSGSLHSFLKEVENRHGLSDTEFIILLNDITSGLEHLRQHGCIHRDIKPGNILRNITQEGKSVYKLSDFGASRILSGNTEEFMSLAGTEEYLHPNMYQKAFIDRGADITFNHTVDLWSLGCTLYQAITGDMPYKPYQGARNDRRTMYEMTFSKPRGAISGSQYIAGGDIIWQRCIPTHCNMTSDLRTHITPILVGLMECDRKFQWTFNTYKNHVTEVLRLKCIFILHCDDMAIHQLYLDPSKSLAEFKDRVAYYTDIPADHQKLYYNQNRFSVFLKGRVTVKAFPPTELNQPVSVMSTQYTETNISIRIALEPFESFRAGSSVSEDIQVTSSQCDTIFNIYKMMLSAKAVIGGCYYVLLALWNDSLRRHIRLQKIYQQWHDSYKQIEYIFDTIKSFSARSLRNGQRSEIDDLFKFQAIAELYDGLKRVKGEILSSSFEEIWGTPPSLIDNDWCTLVGTLLQKGKDVLYRMQSRKKQVLTEYEKIQQNADRSEIQELTARCVFLWQTPCLKERNLAMKEYTRHKKLYKDGVARMVVLEAELKKLEQSRAQCKNVFSEIMRYLCTGSHSRNHRRSPERYEEISIKASRSLPTPYITIESSKLRSIDQSTGLLKRTVTDHKNMVSLIEKELGQLPEISFINESDTETAETQTEEVKKEVDNDEEAKLKKGGNYPKGGGNGLNKDAHVVIGGEKELDNDVHAINGGESKLNAAVHVIIDGEKKLDKDVHVMNDGEKKLDKNVHFTSGGHGIELDKNTDMKNSDENEFDKGGGENKLNKCVHLKNELEDGAVKSDHIMNKSNGSDEGYETSLSNNPRHSISSSADSHKQLENRLVARGKSYGKSQVQDATTRYQLIQTGAIPKRYPLNNGQVTNGSAYKSVKVHTVDIIKHGSRVNKSSEDQTIDRSPEINKTAVISRPTANANKLQLDSVVSDGDSRTTQIPFTPTQTKHVSRTEEDQSSPRLSTGLSTTHAHSATTKVLKRRSNESVQPDVCLVSTDDRPQLPESKAEKENNVSVKLC